MASGSSGASVSAQSRYRYGCGTATTSCPAACAAATLPASPGEDERPGRCAVVEQFVPERRPPAVPGELAGEPPGPPAEQTLYCGQSGRRRPVPRRGARQPLVRGYLVPAQMHVTEREHVDQLVE